MIGRPRKRARMKSRDWITLGWLLHREATFQICCRHVGPTQERDWRARWYSLDRQKCTREAEKCLRANPRWGIIP